MGRFDEVHELIRRIEDATDGNDCIYRGENEDYGKVSSGFYREYFEKTGFGLLPYKDGFVQEIFEEKVVREAATWKYPEDWRYYDAYEDPGRNKPIIDSSWKHQHSDIMTVLQHYGGKTNLIDFTKCLLVALYFACDGAPKKHGRIIIIKANISQSLVGGNKPWIPWESEYDRGARGGGCVRVWEPTNSESRRTDRQKSVFAQPRNGFFHPQNTILIPKENKANVLNYLKEEHGIDRKYIYGDLHGFVTYQSTHKKEVYKALRVVAIDVIADYRDRAIWFLGGAAVASVLAYLIVIL